MRANAECLMSYSVTLLLGAREDVITGSWNHAVHGIGGITGITDSLGSVGPRCALKIVALRAKNGSVMPTALIFIFALAR